MKGNIPQKEARFKTTRILLQHRAAQDILVVPNPSQACYTSIEPLGHLVFMDRLNDCLISCYVKKGN